MPVLKIKNKDGQWIDVAYSGVSGGGSVVGGSALPPVTEADNGKILMVVNGQWQLVELLDAEEDKF